MVVEVVAVASLARLLLARSCLFFFFFALSSAMCGHLFREKPKRRKKRNLTSLGDLFSAAAAATTAALSSSAFVLEQEAPAPFFPAGLSAITGTPLRLRPSSDLDPAQRQALAPGPEADARLGLGGRGGLFFFLVVVVGWPRLERGEVFPFFLFRHDDDERILHRNQKSTNILSSTHLDGLDGRRPFPSPARSRTVPGARPRLAEGVLSRVARGSARRRRHLEASVAAARRHRCRKCARRRGRGLVRLGAVRLGEVGEGLAVP